MVSLRKHMPGAIQTPRRSWKRTKTFSGCQTCRARHLKCDETRPTCLRCTKASLECSGYHGYRAALHWTSTLSISSYGSSIFDRKNETPVAERSKEQEYHEPASGVALNAPSRDNAWSLAVADTLPVGSPGGIIMPFCDENPTSVSTVRVPFPVHDEHGELSRPGRSDQRQTSQQLRSQTEHDARRPFDLVSAGKDATLASHSTCPLKGQNERGLIESAYSAIDDDVPASIESYIGQVPQQIRHIDQLPAMFLQRRLLEYWINELSDAMSPVPGFRNPLKSILVPIALEGAHSNVQQTSSSVALFHIICAAAAGHLSHKDTDLFRREGLNYTTISEYHHNKGIWHLRQNLLINDASPHDPMLGCLLLCIYYEPATADTTLWQTHFQGAVDWLRVTEKRRVWLDDSTIILYQMLMATAIMLRSQLLCPDTLYLPNQAFLNIGLATLPEPYWLDRIIGLPQEILQAISKTIALVAEEHPSHCVRGRSPDHRASLSQDLDQMELELYLSLPKQSFHAGTDTDSGGFLVFHYSYIFYYASIIYFKRTLRDALLDEVQPLVEQSIIHIEALQKFTARPFSPFVWPVAITFFESTNNNLRERALQCLDWHVARSPLSIWRRCRLVVDNLWAERAHDSSAELPWDHFLSRTSTTVSIMMV